MGALRVLTEVRGRPHPSGRNVVKKLTGLNVISSTRMASASSSTSVVGPVIRTGRRCTGPGRGSSGRRQHDQTAV